ncbi:MAG TPA: M28 family peptidase [Saprospiraceae bacterium]|nr:M28 family peptidase [Saprospiraceae bacterium]
MRKSPLLLLFCLLSLNLLTAQEQINEEAVELIKKHGLEEGQVMDIASWIVDVHGPRLTGSPGLDKATDWAVKTLKEWGLDNVHLEEWGPFGRGWELEHFEMHATSPSYWPIIAYPKAWSPSTDGPVEGELIYLEAQEEADLDKYKGKLKGKIVLFDTIRKVQDHFDGPARRFTEAQLLNQANADMPTPRPRRSRRGLGGFSFNQKLRQFLTEEQPLAILDRSYKGDLGTVFVSRATTAEGRPWDEDNTVIPQATLAVEHYNRLLRLTQRGYPVKVMLDLRAKYTNPDGMEHNIIAEIPGTDLQDEVVMFGAHFDSWHAATGATDNGAGSSVMMEAARILLKVIEETGVQPRRTLRLALWTGEEQGLYGSRAYVANHFAEVAPGSYTPQSLKSDQKKISAYYNLDNGTGKVRGVYLQGNSSVMPIFRAWLSPFKELGAGTLTLSNTGGTDHLAFDGVGIPGFQFIQDPIAYSSRTHHSNMDNWDHLQAEDLAQAATVIASFVWHTAMRDEMLPRKANDLEMSPNKSDDDK